MCLFFVLPLLCSACVFLWQVINLRPGNVKALFRQGLCCLNLGRLDQAGELLRKAEAIDSKGTFTLFCHNIIADSIVIIFWTQCSVSVFVYNMKLFFTDTDIKKQLQLLQCKEVEQTKFEQKMYQAMFAQTDWFLWTYIIIIIMILQQHHARVSVAICTHSKQKTRITRALKCWTLGSII